MTKKEHDLAIEYFKDALVHLEGNAWSAENCKTKYRRGIATHFVNTAVCYGKLGETEKGKEAADKALGYDPNWFKPYSTKAALFVLQSNYNGALPLYAKAKERSVTDAERVKMEEREKKCKLKVSLLKKVSGKKRSTSSGDRIKEPPTKKQRVMAREVSIPEEYDLAARKKAIRAKLLGKTSSELKRFLEFNKQPKTGKKEDLVERCLDGFLYGALPKCPTCRRGKLTFYEDSGAYVCGGYFDVNSKRMISCNFRSTSLERGRWEMPRDS